MFDLNVLIGSDVSEEWNDVFSLSGGADAGNPFGVAWGVFGSPEFPVEEPGEGLWVEVEEGVRVVPGPAETAFGGGC